MLKILSRNVVHSWTREKFITTWLSHSLGKGKDKYNFQDKAVPLLFVETCWWNVTYQMAVVGGPLHWGKVIILYFISWKMNPPPPRKKKQKKKQLWVKLLFLKEIYWAYSVTGRLLSSKSRSLCLDSLLD